jgi:hypothetical protein
MTKNMPSADQEPVSIETVYRPFWRGISMEKMHQQFSGESKRTHIATGFVCEIL